MSPITRLTLKAIDHLGGPRVVLAAVPGGIKAIAKAGGVSPGRVSQILRLNPLPRNWAQLIADLAGCSEPEVYLQLGQEPLGSPLGPLFDPASSEPVQPAIPESKIQNEVEGP
jgi:hypothetical protein